MRDLKSLQSNQFPFLFKVLPFIFSGYLQLLSPQVTMLQQYTRTYSAHVQNMAKKSWSVHKVIKF